MATYTSNYAWAKPSGSDPVDISVLNGNLDSQDGIIHDAFLNMAAPFSESSTYAVGDIVLYGTKTYRCRVAVTTAGSWTGATNWDEHKLSELTFDNTPTDGSNNPVKSDGIYDSEKDIYAVMGEMGAKNLIPYPYHDTTKTTNGATFTDNGDGTVTVVTVPGGTTGEAKFNLINTADYEGDKNASLLPTGRLTIIGGVRSGFLLILVRRQNGTNIGNRYRVIDAGDKPSFDWDDSSDTYNGFSLEIYVGAGQIIDTPITINPMVYLASMTDDTWKPYAKTNKQLTDEIATKVDKVTGKGLSTNDYTNTDKAEVAKVANKADKTATASGETLTLVPTSEGRALLHTAYGMSTQSGTPTPSSPVDIESAACDWRINNKNLILFPLYKYRYDSGYLRNGITFTYGENGVITFSGKSTARTNMSLMAIGENTLIPIKDGVTYTVWCHRMGTQSNQVYFTDYQFDENLNLVSNSNHTEANIFNVTGSSSCRYMGLNVGIYNTDVTITDARVEIMVIEGRYTSTDIPIVSDNYIPPRTTLINTDLTLRAIEVSSSDAYNLVRDGKYYIADTLDYDEDNGFVVTRRIGHIASYDSETLTTKWMSSKDVYASGTNPSSGATVDYILATPTTETITTAQALALLGLKTYDESTTISSQAEPACTIAVEYAKERLGALALTAYNTAKGNDLRITALEG